MKKKWKRRIRALEDSLALLRRAFDRGDLRGPPGPPGPVGMTGATGPRGRSFDEPPQPLEDDEPRIDLG